ncbi:UNVERIFIED_CONTAM: hypothetical protein Slati_2500200 [Sesamum latifolium]|uniref:Uncharacterized protein n=1 Tax=Sesamum latifolium TaxID=2727402 RepID=A0AAW2WEF9_9LAMI
MRKDLRRKMQTALNSSARFSEDPDVQFWSEGQIRSARAPGRYFGAVDVFPGRLQALGQERERGMIVIWLILTLRNRYLLM